MSAFFTRAELAQSSCFGTGPSGNKALDQDIVAACISKSICTHSHLNYYYCYDKYMIICDSYYNTCKRS